MTTDAAAASSVNASGPSADDIVCVPVAFGSSGFASVFVSVFASLFDSVFVSDFDSDGDSAADFAGSSGLAVGLPPPLKSVAYQPLPLSWNADADTSLLSALRDYLADVCHEWATPEQRSRAALKVLDE